MNMRHFESEKTSAILNLLIYELDYYLDVSKINQFSEDLTIEEIFEVEGSLNEDTQTGNKLYALIRNNPEIGGLTLVDSSWTSGEYGISENPGGLYAATFVSPVRRRP